MDKPLLILDIDNTLIFSFKRERKFSISKNDWYITNENIKEDFLTINKYYTTKRPYLSEFLTYIKIHFDIAVWTAAGDIYAKEICENIDIHNDLKFLYHSNHCTPRANKMSDIIYVKNLQKLKRKGINLEKTIIVDDLQASAIYNYGNLIRIKPFYGDSTDIELLKLTKYLEEIKDIPNYRAIEKRGWETKFN